jgi:hypothetical protein
VGDVDALRAFEAGGAGDVGMVVTQQRTPGEFDDLRAGVDGDLEPGVEVVARERLAWWHG